VRLPIARGSVVELTSACFSSRARSINHRAIVDGACSAYRQLMILVTRVKWMGGVALALRELVPYAAMALLLPGGTLIVTSLWILRLRPWFFAHLRRGLAIVLALLPTVVVSGSALEPGPTSAAG